MRRKFNGDRLKSARLYRGLTLAELGNSIDISKQSLSLYENNKNEPDFSTINKLSSELHFPKEYFFQNDEITVKSDATYFRSLMSTTKKSRVSQIKKVEHISALYEALYKYIDFPNLNLPEFEFDKNNLDDKEIELIANKLREFWNLEDGPIQDLQYELERNGIIVTGFDTEDEKIDAFSQRVTIDENVSFIIVLSIGSKPKGRINFDMAHELGHIILHPWTEDLETLSKEEFKEREQQANKFASSFLMPKKSFENEVSLYPTELTYYIHLKGKWNCSIQAMLYRTHDLGVISTNQFQYLMRQISSKGWRKKEPDDVPFYLNDNIFQGAIDLLLENGYKRDDIVDIFRESSIAIFSDEIEKLLDLKEGTLFTRDNLSDKDDNVIELKLYKSKKDK